tara:strand:- start:164 stop:502 length:339 start_codon:yes stop_codon:yes gene_type:complete
MQENNENEESSEKGLAKFQENSLELPKADHLFTAPPRHIQVFSFVAILVGGLCGGLIGYAFTDLQCSEGCSNLSGISTIIGALVGAGGVGIVSVLVLRAVTEWRTKENKGAK